LIEKSNNFGILKIFRRPAAHTGSNRDIIGKKIEMLELLLACGRGD
jgi:hypothetical protein